MSKKEWDAFVKYKEEVKEAANGKWPMIYASTCPQLSGSCDGNHGPCPMCGGKDRYRFTNMHGDGSIFCNQCCQHIGDGFEAIKFVNGWTFVKIVMKVGEAVGLKPKRTLTKVKAIDHHLEFEQEQSIIDLRFNLFCDTYKPISVDAVKRAGGRVATYRQSNPVIAFPMYGHEGVSGEPIGYSIFSVTGSPLPAYKPDEKGNMKLVAGPKSINTAGSTSGVIGEQAVIEKDRWHQKPLIKLEGETDMLAAMTMLGDQAYCFTLGAGAKQGTKGLAFMATWLSGTKHFVIHDADVPGQDGAKSWCSEVAGVCSETRNVSLPYPVEKTKGKDFRQWAIDGGDVKALKELMLAGAVIAPGDTTIGKISLNELDVRDPQRMKDYNNRQYKRETGRDLFIRYWRQDYYFFNDGSYRVISKEEFEGRLSKIIRDYYLDEFYTRAAAGKTEEGETPKYPKKQDIDLLAAIYRSSGIVTDRTPFGTWIDSSVKEQKRLLSFRNGLLDIDEFKAKGKNTAIRRHDPRWWSNLSFPYDYDSMADCPHWQKFLMKSVPDMQCQQLLQEWMGYCLLPGNSMQKFLMIMGSGANGKSVFMAALTALVGRENVSNVQIEAFREKFHLSETLGKLVNIIDDVNPITDLAEGTFKSFTSGNRVFFDRKNKTGVSTEPTAKMTIAMNEPPRIRDRSDGVWRRMLLIPFSQTISAQDRIPGMDQVDWWHEVNELPGILNWALDGLMRLEAQGEFTEPSISIDEIESYRRCHFKSAISWMTGGCVFLVLRRQGVRLLAGARRAAQPPGQAPRADHRG